MQSAGKLIEHIQSCPGQTLEVEKTVPKTVSHCLPPFQYYIDPFSLWSSNKQHHIKPFLFIICHVAPCQKHSTLILRALSTVWEETLPIRFSLVTKQFLASCLGDLTFDPTFCPLLHNFPPWLKSLFLLWLPTVNRSIRLHMFHLLTLQSHFSLSCLTSVFFRFPLFVCLFLYHPLSHYNPEKPRGCLYSREDVEVI